MGNIFQDDFFAVLMAASLSVKFVYFLIAQYFYAMLIMFKNEKNEKYMNPGSGIKESLELIIFNIGLYVFSEGKIIKFLYTMKFLIWFSISFIVRIYYLDKPAGQELVFLESEVFGVIFNLFLHAISDHIEYHFLLLW